MDIKDYISSGIIELYVTGAATKEEAAEVERLASEHKAVADEITRTQEIMDHYALLHARNPHPQMRQKIIESIHPSDKMDTRLAAQLKHIHDNSMAYKYLIAASIAALFITTFFSYFFYSKWNEAEKGYTELLKERAETNKSITEMKTELESRYHDLIIIRDAANKIIPLVAKDSTKQYAARIFWSSSTRKAYLDVLSLQSPPEGMQYQLWAIKNNQPINAGVFNLGENTGVQELNTVMAADSWIVTLEKGSGAILPSMTNVYLVSK